jgi:hypothetical protein
VTARRVERTPGFASILLALAVALAPVACAPDAGAPAAEAPPGATAADTVAADAAPTDAEPSRAGPFLAQYARYCGATYEGRSVMVDLGDDHPLDGARLRVTMASCTADEVRMPFQVDDDRSRTWILTRTGGRLHLAHDHRYEDGSEHPANFYGGYADPDRGSATRQYFPADDRTIADRPARAANEWSKEFDVQRERYYYRLYLDGELRYEAEFDLSRPVPLDRSE